MGADPGEKMHGAIPLLHETLFSLNISYAITFAVIAFRAFRRQGGLRLSAFYFLAPGENLFADIADRANRLLHLDLGSSVGWEIASLASLFIVAAVITFMLRLARGTVVAHIVLGPIAIVMGIALLPAFWLYAAQATWPPTVAPYSFWTSGAPALTLLKISLVLGFLYLTRQNELSIVWRAVALAIYYLFWILLPWDLPSWSLRLCFIVFPLSGFAWLAYTSSRPKIDTTIRLAN